MGDDPFMSVAEFAELPFDAKYAVWRAADRGLVDAIAAIPSQPHHIRRFNRQQVRAVLGELKAVWRDNPETAR